MHAAEGYEPISEDVNLQEMGNKRARDNCAAGLQAAFGLPDNAKILCSQLRPSTICKFSTLTSPLLFLLISGLSIRS